MSKYGHLHIIIGPMFSGKSSALMKELQRRIFCGDCIIINHSFDVRSGSQSPSLHSPIYNLPVNVDDDGRLYMTIQNRKVLMVKATKLSDIDPKLLESYRYIFIDEAQFFEDLVDGVNTMLKADKQIVAVGLKSDYNNQPIGSILNLIANSDSVECINAMCIPCSKRGIETDAPFTRRLVSSLSQILIGSDEYIATCRKCHDVEI